MQDFSHQQQFQRFFFAPPKGGLVQGLHKAIHGNCAIYFYPGVIFTPKIREMIPKFWLTASFSEWVEKSWWFAREKICQNPRSVPSVIFLAPFKQIEGKAQPEAFDPSDPFFFGGVLTGSILMGQIFHKDVRSFGFNRQFFHWFSWNHSVQVVETSATWGLETHQISCKQLMDENQNLYSNYLFPTWSKKVRWWFQKGKWSNLTHIFLPRFKWEEIF